MILWILVSSFYCIWRFNFVQLYTIYTCVCMRVCVCTYVFVLRHQFIWMKNWQNNWKDGNNRNSNILGKAIRLNLNEPTAAVSVYNKNQWMISPPVAIRVMPASFFLFFFFFHFSQMDSSDRQTWILLLPRVLFSADGRTVAQKAICLYSTDKQQ